MGKNIKRDHVRINVNQIPGIEMRILCSTLVKAVEKFYKDPENVRQYKEWQKEQYNANK